MSHCYNNHTLASCGKYCSRLVLRADVLPPEQQQVVPPPRVQQQIPLLVAQRLCEIHAADIQPEIFVTRRDLDAQ